MSSDDVPSADTDGDGLVTATEISSLESAAKTASWTLQQAVAKAKNEGARLTSGAKSLLSTSDPVETITDSVSSLTNFVVDTVMSRVVKPLFTAFYWVPVVLAGAISMLFWGQDLALEERVQGWPGLADLPILVANVLIDATRPIGYSILVFVRETNRGLILTFINEGGGLAPVLIAGLGMVELGLLVALLWSGVTLASSLPVISTIVAGGRVVTRPFRAILERFKQ